MFIFYFITCCYFSLPANSQGINPDYDLFKSEKILRINLIFNIDSMFKNRNDESIIHPGILNYYNEEGSAPYRKETLSDNEKEIPDVLYMGICLKKKELIPYLDYYFSIKDEIYNLYNNFSYLNKEQKESALYWYDEFYSLIKRPSKANRIFKENCYEE